MLLDEFDQFVGLERLAEVVRSAHLGALLVAANVFARREDYLSIENPFEPGDEIVLLPAIRPDIALIHADCADRHGNIWVGGRHELKSMAHAAKHTIATVEEIVDGDLREDPAKSANLIGALYVDAVAHAPGGAWPIAAPGRYDLDEAHLADYAQLARDDAAFADYLSRTALIADGANPAAAE